ncbi:MAG: T9SS type A sorting domain-containing protein [Saprospiraceae bacterium]|jgi:hypothetical protein|nr:T9SS type A sorting domain-containing protein [Candidatus Brachybacter algidus]HQX44706.1 T9SS type A sorting domain-containing protein [Saprospiraceae bacterium]
MKYFTIAFVFFLINNYSIAQHSYIPFVKANKFWFYTVINDHEPAAQSENAYALWTKGDTIIAGKDYTKIYKSFLEGTHPCQFPPCFSPIMPYKFLDTLRIGYLREDTLQKLVFYLPEIQTPFECANQEQEIFNFNMQIDDTISNCFRTQLGGEGHWAYPYGAIDTVEEMFLYGKTRTVLSFMVLGNQGLIGHFPSLLIEGIGMNYYDAIHFNYYHVFRDFCEGDLFQCHISSSTRDPDKPELQLFPNPSTGLFKVSGINHVVSASLTDVGGRSYKISVNDNEINISNLKTGIYFVEFRDVNNHPYFSKVVKL